MLMADLVDTAQRMGIKTITIEAQHVGRYAWARLGFVPDVTPWRSVRADARRRLFMAKGELLEAYRTILDGENPKLIREVASWRDPVTSLEEFDEMALPKKVPLGQALLLEIPGQWHGSFDLDDKETMVIFRDYVERSV